MKKFAVFDIDGTLIRWQLYHAIADNLVKLGYIAPVKFQAIKDARMVWKRRESNDSFKRYENKLIKLYSEILSEITVEQFEKTSQAVFEEYKDQIYTYTRDLITRLKDKNYLLFAISGSQIEVVEKIASYYGFDDCIGSVYERRGNKFTGKVVVASFNKNKLLKELVTKHKAIFKGSIAVGDGLSDAGMFEMVETPIAFNPEKRLFDLARNEQWKVVIERKNVVYELEESNGRYQLVKTNSR